MNLPFLKKFKPSGQWIMGFLIVLLVIDLSLLAFINRKPLCFESTLVEEVEWISSDDKKTSLFNCNTKNKIPIETVFIEKHDEIQKRLSQLENLLKTNFKSTSPIKLTVQGGGSSVLQFSSESVVIGEELFFNKKWIFERAYLRSWLQQFQKGHGLGLLRLDIMSFFLMWNLDVHDQFDENWQYILKQWPNMSTTWSGYCSSPIKDEAYMPLCIGPTFSKKAESLTPLTVSFWISFKLWQAFQALPIVDQMGFFNAIPKFIEELSHSDDIELSEMSLNELDLFVRKETEALKSTLEKVGYSSFGSTFHIKMMSDLDVYSSDLGKVGLFVKKDNDWSTLELQSFQNLSFQELNYRILAENPEGFWNFPWLAPINLKAIPSIRALNFIFLTCEWPTVKELLNFQEHADKVIVVKSCPDEPVTPIYSGLLHRGLQFFSLDNKDIKFIYINIEALRFLIKRDEKLRDKKLGVFSQSNGRKNYLAEKANWSSALWNQKYRAYEVQATVDTVEWFKLPENTWPDFVD